MGCNSCIRSCGFCLNKSVKLLTLCIQDNYQVLQGLPSLRETVKYHSSYSYLMVCEICLLQLKVNKPFQECEGSVYYCGINRMQDQIQQKEETQHIENTSCTCEQCKSKFGDLPLLAEVVDQIDKRKSPTSSERSNISQETFSVPETIPQPSTSAGISHFEPEQGTAQADLHSAGISNEETVTKRRAMNCEHCGKCFTHRGDLNKHLRKHTGEQPFQCSVCDRRFAHTSNLARHLRVHSGDKPFQCERCNRSFSRKDKLVMHQKTKLCMKAGQSSMS